MSAGAMSAGAMSAGDPGGRSSSPRPRVLIMVANLPVPLDRRVWLECKALTEAGYDVSVVCPKAPGDPNHHVLDGVELDKYRPYPPTTRKIGLMAEQVYTFARTACLAVKVWRRHRFDAMQTCNPPDVLWPLGLLFRAVGGTRFIFDQHDLCPELYRSRFPDGPRLPYLGLRILEWCTYRTAHHVIATNESYRSTAVERGGKQPDQVTIVRTGPDPDRLRRGTPDPALRRGRRFLVCYLGVMGPQDGVDIVLKAADVIVHELDRHDISFTLMGTGDCYEALVAQCDELGLGDYVHFTGRAPDEVVFRVFSTADIGLSADPKNPLNDVSTMNKTLEYMSFELPVVAFDLRETRVSAGDAAVYARPNEVRAYAEAIVELIDDEPRRRSMGATGRARIEDKLAWHYQSDAYVGVYDRLVGTGCASVDAPSRLLTGA